MPEIAPDQPYDAPPPIVPPPAPPPVVEHPIGVGIAQTLAPPPPTVSMHAAAAAALPQVPPVSTPILPPDFRPVFVTPEPPLRAPGRTEPTRIPTGVGAAATPSAAGGAQRPLAGFEGYKAPSLPPLSSMATAEPVEFEHEIFRGAFPGWNRSTGSPWTTLPPGARLAPQEYVYSPGGNPRDAGFYSLDSYGRSVPIYRNDYVPAPELGPGYWRISGSSGPLGGQFASATPPLAVPAPVPPTVPTRPGQVSGGGFGRTVPIRPTGTLITAARPRGVGTARLPLVIGGSVGATRTTRSGGGLVPLMSVSRTPGRGLRATTLRSRSIFDR